MLISSESLEKYDANSIVDNKTKLNEDVECTCLFGALQYTAVCFRLGSHPEDLLGSTRRDGRIFKLCLLAPFQMV